MRALAEFLALVVMFLAVALLVVTAIRSFVYVPWVQ